MIFLKPILNKNKNEYYYNIFSEKGLYKDKSNTEYFYMNVCILQMLYFDGIDVSEGIDLIKQVYQKSVIFVTIDIFYIIDLKFNQMSEP